VDRTVILPFAGSDVVLLAEVGDEPPHDVVRSPNDPATKTTPAVQRNRPIASPLTATPSRNVAPIHPHHTDAIKAIPACGKGLQAEARLGL
jgi:hypothetical protein